MIKINSLLNKVDLFERLACYGDRRDFLKALAQSDVEVSPQVESDYKSAINQMNQLISTLGLDTFPLDPDTTTVAKVKSRLDQLEKEIGNRGGAVSVKYSSQLSNIRNKVNAYDSMIEHLSENIPSEEEAFKKAPVDYAILPSDMGDFTSVPKSTKPTGDVRMAKYYKLLQDGESLVEKIQYADEDIDHSLLVSLYPQFSKLVVDLNNFKRDFPQGTLSGEALTMSKRVEKLLNMMNVLSDKMSRADLRSGQ
jgi:hypothetical protein